MEGILHIISKKSVKPIRKAKIELLGSDPLFYKALSVDKKVYKIKRRRWN